MKEAESSKAGPVFSQKTSLATKKRAQLFWVAQQTNTVEVSKLHQWRLPSAADLGKSGGVWQLSRLGGERLKGSEPRCGGYGSLSW